MYESNELDVLLYNWQFDSATLANARKDEGGTEERKER
jgi:hypothetical protein